MPQPLPRDTATSTAVLDWLLDSEPALRWQVLRDLIDAPAHEIAAERARVATEGTVATLLALQADDGRWGGAAWNHGWNSTMHTVLLLRELGLDPDSAEARRAMMRIRAHVTWKGCAPDECDDNAYFTGEVEPCINGQVAVGGAYFGEDVRGIIERLLSEQLADGGWNCEAERGSIRSSFNTTICVLEALLEFTRRAPERTDVVASRRRGEAYLLERGLFRRQSTGEPIPHDRKSGAIWSRFAFPSWWRYDVLRALDHLRAAELTPDARVADAIALVEAKRGDDGRWRTEIEQPGTNLVTLTDVIGQPDRWLTLRALRVLRWYAQRNA